MKRIAIIGSHGLYAQYGGWDQLVNNLVENASTDISYLVFNPKETPVDTARLPKNTKVIQIPLSAAGYQGLFFDFISIFISVFYCRNQLLLGIQGIPASSLCKILSFNRIRITVNIGGVEWERPQFPFWIRAYLKTCFILTRVFADKIVLDNEHYQQFFNAKSQISKKIEIIKYGGFIDRSRQHADSYFMETYPFIQSEYFLSISRSIEDNKILEICEYFQKRPQIKLVLISNLSNSSYGMDIYNQFSSTPNIILIDGLYVKSELDFIRLNCKAYIHTHTLCGSAPSLIEMIVTGKPIFSIDVPQNRYTLDNYGYFFTDFDELDVVTKKHNIDEFRPSQSLSKSFSWGTVISQYETCFRGS